LLSENPPLILIGIDGVDGPHTQSDTNGKFHFSAVKPGRYRLIADKSGFPLQSYGGKDDWREGTFVDLRVGAVTEISFPMIAAGTISGVLLDENNEPIGGRRVTASHLIHDALGKVVSDAVAEGTTDIQGRFTIPKLPAGMYSLPGVSQSIKVEAGSVLSGYTARMVTAPDRVTVRGRVFGPYPDSARVSMAPRGKCSALARAGYGGGYGAPIRTDGSFEIHGVAAGAYTMCVSAPFETMRHGWLDFDWLDFDAGPRDVNDLVFHLEPRFRVSGQVTLDGQPAPGLTVTLRPPPFPSAWRSGQVKPDGTFTLTEVWAASYDLSLSSVPSGAYVASIGLGDREVSGRLDLSGGDPGQPLVIAMKSSSSEILGSAPLGSIITLIPEPERPDQINLSLRTTTDTTGTFILKNVAPGKYRITAWDELDRNAHLDPEFTGQHRDKGTLITIEEDTSQSITLR
jgi:hypothetical protein